MTHSIEEALVVGNRVLLLSPHPGQVRAEFNAHAFGPHSAGGVAFQQTAQRIHRLLFDVPDETLDDDKVAPLRRPSVRRREALT